MQVTSLVKSRCRYRWVSRARACTPRRAPSLPRARRADGPARGEVRGVRRLRRRRHRHEVSFDGGTDVAEGKAMLAQHRARRRTTHIPHVNHRAGFSHWPLRPAGHPNDGAGDGVRLASVDARRALVTTLGRDWMSDTDMATFAATASSSSSSSSRQYALEPYEPGYGLTRAGEGGGRMPGGKVFAHSNLFQTLQSSKQIKSRPALCPPPLTVRRSSRVLVGSLRRGAGSPCPMGRRLLNNSAPESVAVARHFAKSVDVFDGIDTCDDEHPAQSFLRRVRARQPAARSPESRAAEMEAVEAAATRGGNAARVRGCSPSRRETNSVYGT